MEKHNVAPIVMVRHATPSCRKALFTVTEALDIGRELYIETSPPHGYWQCPWVLCPQFKNETWVHCLASPPDLIPEKHLGRVKELQVATTGFAPQDNRTFARLYMKGKLAAELEVSGKANDPLEVCTFKSSVHPKTLLKSCKTAQEAVEAFFSALEIKLRNLQVARLKSDFLELQTTNGKPVKEKELAEMTMLVYPPLTADENPASVSLMEAIDAKDLDGVRRAIADGASLEFLPGSTDSPLAYSQPKMALSKWRPIAEALVKAGAPIDGYEWEDPLICTLIKEDTYEPWCIEFLEAILEMGADVNAPKRVPKLLIPEIGTALHLAVKYRHPELARFLISKGASLKARDSEGKTPLDLVEEIAAEDPDYDASLAAEDSKQGEPPPKRLTLMEFTKQDLDKSDEQKAAEWKRRTSRIVKVVRDAAGKKK
jgi:hypothetical protein